MILKDRRIELTQISEVLDTLYERVDHTIHVNLGMRKMSAKWIRKCLIFDQKHEKVEALCSICAGFGKGADFLSDVDTMAETRVHFYDLKETAIDGMESQDSKKFRVQIPPGKVLAVVFWQG